MIPADPRKWYGSADCDTIYTELSIDPSVHNQLIQTIFGDWPVIEYGLNNFKFSPVHIHMYCVFINTDKYQSTTRQMRYLSPCIKGCYLMKHSV